MPNVKKYTVAENNPVKARWRFLDADRASYDNADITSCKYDAIQLQPYSSTKLADDTALTLSVDDAAPTTAEVGWFDTLQVEADDAGWEDDDDSTGYNCVALFPGTLFATPGKVLIEVYVVLAGDATTVRCATFEITVTKAHGA